MPRSRNRRSTMYLGTLTLDQLAAAADPDPDRGAPVDGEVRTYPSWNVERLEQGEPFTEARWAHVVTYYVADNAHALAAELNARAAEGHGLPARVVEVWR